MLLWGRPQPAFTHSCSFAWGKSTIPASALALTSISVPARVFAPAAYVQLGLLAVESEGDSRRISRDDLDDLLDDDSNSERDAATAAWMAAIALRCLLRLGVDIVWG